MRGVVLVQPCTNSYTSLHGGSKPHEEDMTLDNRIPLHARGDLRRLTRLSVYELSDETGIPRDRLIDWENGERLLYSETSLIIDALVCHSGKRLPELLRMHARGFLVRRTHTARTRKVRSKHGTRR